MYSFVLLNEKQRKKNLKSMHNRRKTLLEIQLQNVNLLLNSISSGYSTCNVYPLRIQYSLNNSFGSGCENLQIPSQSQLSIQKLRNHLATLLLSSLLISFIFRWHPVQTTRTKNFHYHLEYKMCMVSFISFLFVSLGPVVTGVDISISEKFLNGTFRSCSQVMYTLKIALSSSRR